jgi:tetratricopeptide (TPR) repeat protein
VKAQPNDGLMINTLGVAYYRLGKFAEAIRTLERSIEVRGFNPEDGFFLAMAHARLGRHDQAREVYFRADQSLRDQHVSMDREPFRFREEAATVLEVTSAVATNRGLDERDPDDGGSSSQPSTPK